jgi:hypothetical protein
MQVPSMKGADVTGIRTTRLSSYFVRNVRALDQLEVFLISAVSMILIIRILLELTGYPQLGGDSLHIAHMLWGGLGMLVAALLRQMMLGAWVEYASAFIGGLGFGAFIDEIGKFVTQDNNYFFGPTFSLIYVIFVLIYLISRWLLTSRGYTQREYLMNAVNALQEYRSGVLPENRKTEIQYFLERTDPENKLTATIADFIRGVDTVTAKRPSFYERIRSYLQNLYYRVIEMRFFTPLLNLYFILQALAGASFIVEEVFFPKGLSGEPESPSFSDISLLISSGISTLFIILGVILLHRSRLKAYRMFERAMLVSILLSQIFLFTINQLGAITGLIYSLLILGALRFLIQQERKRELHQLDTSAQK